MFLMIAFIRLRNYYYFWFVDISNHAMVLGFVAAFSVSYSDDHVVFDLVLLLFRFLNQLFHSRDKSHLGIV